MRNIEISPGQAIIEANGKVDNFKYFALQNPARLVVDVYGLKPSFKERLFPAEAGFKQVRLGTYNDKTRLVFDASGATVPQHNVEGRDSDLLVSWGDTAQLANQQKAPEPVAEPAAEQVDTETPQDTAENPAVVENEKPAAENHRKS